jgi:hypothetical protein
MFYGLIKGYFFGMKTSTEISEQKYQLRFEVLNWMPVTPKLEEGVFEESEIFEVFLIPDGHYFAAGGN